MTNAEEFAMHGLPKPVSKKRALAMGCNEKVTTSFRADQTIRMRDLDRQSYDRFGRPLHNWFSVEVPVLKVMARIYKRISSDPARKVCVCKEGGLYYLMVDRHPECINSHQVPGVHDDVED